MKNEDIFPTDQLIRNTISIYRNGYLSDDQVIFALDFAAKLGDKEAAALLDRCNDLGVAQALGE